jgi:hypothetical protein
MIKYEPQHNETTLPIEGFENYRISNCGRVVNKTNKVLNTYLNKQGYECIGLFKNGKDTKFRIHRLVASAYLPNLNFLPEVNHLDGNKLNNHVSNLQWCSRLENLNHAWENKLLHYDPENKTYTITDSSDLGQLIDFLNQGYTVKYKITLDQYNLPKKQKTPA